MMIGLRSGLFLAALVLGLAFRTSGALGAECPAFPNVSWWGDLSHASVTDYVGVKYGGDWKPYIDKWKRQLAKLRQIQQKGTTAIVRVKTVRSGKIKLRGKMLDSYVSNVDQRLDVMRCLSGEKIPAGKPIHPQTAWKTQAKAEPELAKAKVCFQCHGEGGVSELPTVPNLAGQNELYLVKQLKEFQAVPPSSSSRNGASWRSSRFMKSHANRLNNEEIWRLSAYFAAQPSCSHNRQAAFTPKRPKVAEKCVECHAADGKGAFLEAPILRGQNRDYLVSQLKAFQASSEKSSDASNSEGRYHYYMSMILKSLNKEDLEELASYFSGFQCRS